MLGSPNFSHHLSPKPYISYSLNSCGVIWGIISGTIIIIGVTKRDTRILDYNSCVRISPQFQSYCSSAFPIPSPLVVPYHKPHNPNFRCGHQKPSDFPNSKPETVKDIPKLCTMGVYITSPEQVEGTTNPNVRLKN